MECACECEANAKHPRWNGLTVPKSTCHEQHLNVGWCYVGAIIVIAAVAEEDRFRFYIVWYVCTTFKLTALRIHYLDNERYSYDCYWCAAGGVRMCVRE